MLSYYQLAELVAAAYSEAPKITLNDPIIRVDDDIRLVLNQYADELVVAVPGTTDLQGWLDDFSTWPRSFDELGWYHEGFGSKGIALFRALEPRLPGPTYGKITTYVGHSLGAALARVLAAMHAKSCFGAYRLMTLGEPRGAALWNVQSWDYLRTAKDNKRFVRAGDPIPDVPFRPLYKHLSRKFPIGASVKSDNPMADHNIALYVSDLKTITMPKTIS